MKKFGIFVAFVLLLVSLLVALGEPAGAESVYVVIRDGTYLNGREHPSTKAHITMRLFNGDKLEVVSFNGEWVEVVGGESGTSFVKAEYLSEVKNPVSYINISGGRVRVRKSPFSNQAVSWIKSGQTVTITRQILGWGYTHGGWVDLSYFQPK